MVVATIAVIESGELEVGEWLPSIREMSARLDINRSTTALSETAAAPPPGKLRFSENLARDVR
jgi:hypothetical protein